MPHSTEASIKSFPAVSVGEAKSRGFMDTHMNVGHTHSYLPSPEKSHNILELLGNVKATLPRVKFKLDPLKALEPYKKKLSLPEAQRIIGVFEDMQFKCGIIAIAPVIPLDMPIYDIIIDRELRDMLVKHSSLISYRNKSIAKTPEDVSKGISETRTLDVTRPSTAGMGQPISDSLTPKPVPTMGNTLNAQLVTTARVQSSTLKPEQAAYKHPSVKFPDRSDSHQIVSSAMSLTNAELDESIIKHPSRKIEIEKSIKNILRYFNKHRALGELLIQALSAQRSKETATFINMLGDLKEIVLERLLISPAEQYEKVNFITQVIAEEKHNQLLISHLKEEVKTAIETRDSEIKKRNEIIKSLQNTLRSIENATEEEIKRAKTESEKQIQADIRNSNIKKEKYSLELKGLTANLNNLITANREEEMAMRKKKFKVESEVDSWVQRFDNDMNEKQEEYERIDKQYQEEKKQLHELEERFRILEGEYIGVIEKINEQNRLREVALRLFDKQTHAVLCIQAMWRAYRVRKGLKAKSKKKPRGRK